MNLLERLRTLNDGLIIAELSVDSIDSTSAIVRVNSNSRIYRQGSIEVTFTVALKLEEVVEQKELG
jgi:hypothetical protein